MYLVTPHRSSRQPFRSAVLFCFLALFLASCGRLGEVRLPANPILSGGLGWAVVKDAYVRLKENPGDTARDMDHLRRGIVVHLEERAFASSSSGKDSSPNGYWFRIEQDGVKGWVQSEALDIYASEDQARKAAQGYN